MSTVDYANLAPIPEVIEGVLPAQEVSILSGASGAGKTTLIMQILRAQQRGEPIFGHKIKPDLRIGYVSGDRSWRSYRQLADDLQFDVNHVKICAMVNDPTVNLDTFKKDPLRLLSDIIGKMMPVDLLIVDPLIMFLGCDPNKWNLVAAAMLQIGRLCDINKLTILGTHHATKARTDFAFKRPQDRISGSSALLGFTSTQLFLNTPEESGLPFYQWHIVHHNAPPQVIHMARPELAFTQVPSEVVEAMTNQPKSAQETIGQLLRILPASGAPISRGEIVGQLSDDASPRKVDDLLLSLTNSGLLYRDGKGGYGRRVS